VQDALEGSPCLFGAHAGNTGAPAANLSRRGGRKYLAIEFRGLLLRTRERIKPPHQFREPYLVASLETLPRGEARVRSDCYDGASSTSQVHRLTGPFAHQSIAERVDGLVTTITCRSGSLLLGATARLDVPACGSRNYAAGTVHH
jgi:hypothetical protein